MSGRSRRSGGRSGSSSSGDGGGGGGSSNRNNNRSGSGAGRDDDDNDDDDDHHHVAAGMFTTNLMHLMMSGAAAGGRSRGNRPEDLTKPSSVKCPQCQDEEEYAPALAVGPMKHRYSHNARVLWHAAKCPVCLEEAEPPVVNLMCGHILCIEHFERLNGKVGEDAMLSIPDQLTKEREERRNRADDENDNDNGGVGMGFGPEQALFQALMHSGMPMSGGGYGAMRISGGTTRNNNHPFQFLPHVMRGFDGHDREEDDDDDDEEQYNDDDDDGDEDSDYNDIPPLIPSARQGAAAAASASSGTTNTANNNNNNASTRSTATANPRRGVAAAAAASNNSSNNRNRSTATSNAAANNAGNNDNNGEPDSDNDSMPGLIPRRGAAHNNNRPAPRQEQPNDDSSSDDADMPPLAPRGNNNRGGAANDDTSSSHTDVPDLLAPNDDEDDSSDGEDEDDNDDDDDDDEMPDLVPRDIEAEDSDGSDDDIPDLLPRGQEDDTGSSDDEDDDMRNNDSSSEGSDDSDMPGLIGRGAGNIGRRRGGRGGGASNRANNNRPRPNANRASTNRRNNNADSSEDDSDDESIPGLIPPVSARTGAAPNANRPNANLSFDSDDSNNSGSGDSMPELLQRENDSDEDNTPPRAAAAAAAARVGPTPEMIQQWTMEEMAKGRRMKPGELKRKLRDMNVDTTSFVEKPELVKAWAEQVVRRRVENYVPTAAEVQATAAASAAAAAAAAAPPPVDPYADMPPLILAEDPPPKNGIWLLAPASSSSGSRHDDRVVLHYSFVLASRVQSVHRGFFPKGSVILSAKPGICWIYAPTTTTTNRPNPGVAAAASAASTTANSHSWELYAVRDVNLTVQMFTFEWPGAEAASLVADGRGAAYVLLPTDPGNAATCDRTLIRINSQYEEGKNILQHLVPCHSRLYRDRAGGVFVHVPNHTSNSSSGGITTRTNDDSERLSPGIWYITPFEVTCVASNVATDAKVNLDGSRTGLLILSPMDENDGDGADDDSSLLVHVGPAGELHRRVIPVNFSKATAVLDDGIRGALIHCRNHDNRWKLCRAAWEQVNEETGQMNEALVEFVDCPGRTKLVTDGRGGVWMWKKVGKRNNRAVSYISRDGELTESIESFPGGAVMEG